MKITQRIGSRSVPVNKLKIKSANIEIKPIKQKSNFNSENKTSKTGITTKDDDLGIAKIEPNKVIKIDKPKDEIEEVKEKSQESSDEKLVIPSY